MHTYTKVYTQVIYTYKHIDTTRIMLAHIYIVHIYLCIYLCMIIPVYIPSYMCSIYAYSVESMCVLLAYMHMYIEISMHTSIYGYRHSSDHAGTHRYEGIYTIYADTCMCYTKVYTQVYTYTHKYTHNHTQLGFRWHPHMHAYTKVYTQILCIYTGIYACQHDPSCVYSRIYLQIF